VEGEGEWMGKLGKSLGGEGGGEWGGVGWGEEVQCFERGGRWLMDGGDRRVGLRGRGW